MERFSWQGLQNNYEIHYQYDANGNITQITDGKGKIQYTYDTRNQLIREEREADRQTITYAYDKNGNLLQKNQYEYQPEAAMETLASATPSETKIYRYEGNWKDQLTSYNGETIAYDAMGNPTVCCEVQRDGKEVCVKSIDGEADYYSLSATWMVSSIERNFFRTKVSLYSDSDDIENDMEDLFRLLSNSQ